MIEPRELARWQRNLNAMIRNAGQDDPEAFAAVVAILDEAVKVSLPAAAQTLRTVTSNGTRGYSWQDLGRALGVHRSAAYQRFGRKTSTTLKGAS